MPRVTIVHPMHVVRALAVQILEAHGFAPIEAETVEDALAVIRVDPPAVAIVDERLVEALPRLPMPWIALGSRGRRAPLMAAGACCVVDKPFSPEELVRAVTCALEVHGSPTPPDEARRGREQHEGARRLTRLDPTRSPKGRRVMRPC